jgi:hypothetical protein
MNEKQIIDAYVRIRTIDNTIPDDVLDFMKNAAIERLRGLENPLVKKMEFMIENGLGWEDMKNDITMPNQTI